MAASPPADSDFGARMRRAREARSVSLRQIADATKISVSALEALERNDTSRLPGGIFSRGFVRSYASAIGVDPEQAVKDFLSQCPHDVGDSAPGSPSAVEREGTRLNPPALVLLGTVALGVVVILFWSFAIH